jgi:NADH dehydrogenase
MHVLVVGGTGFVGQHLCRELHERGHVVTAMARNPGEATLPGGIDTVRGDVTAYDSIEGAFEGQDAVVNLVALSPLFKPKGGDDAHFAVHRDGTQNVLRAAETHGVPTLVQLSALGADPDGETAYIRSKGLAEAAVRDSALEWVIFRPSVIFGEGGEFVSFTKKLATPYLTPLPGGGKTRFQPIWVGDIVPMFADAVEGTLPDEAAAEAGTEEAGTDEAGTDDEDEEASTEEENGDAGIDEAEAEAGTDEEDGEDGPDGAGSRSSVGPSGNPHAGQIYEIGGPEVLTLAEVARLAHAADGKPVDVVPIPMALAGIGLRLADFVPGAPMGSDQFRSLQFDNTTDDNDVAAFGVSTEGLTTLASYLGVDPDAAE